MVAKLKKPNQRTTNGTAKKTTNSTAKKKKDTKVAGGTLGSPGPGQIRNLKSTENGIIKTYGKGSNEHRNWLNNQKTFWGLGWRV